MSNEELAMENEECRTSNVFPSFIINCSLSIINYQFISYSPYIDNPYPFVLR